jgi:hypothetical protein
MRKTVRWKKYLPLLITAIYLKADVIPITETLYCRCVTSNFPLFVDLGQLSKQLTPQPELYLPRPKWI